MGSGMMTKDEGIMTKEEKASFPSRFIKPEDIGFKYAITNKKNLKRVKAFFNANGYRSISRVMDGKIYLWVNAHHD